MKKIAILLINNSGTSIGGAQRRFISLFNFIITQRSDVFLIISNSLFKNFKEAGLLNDNPNIIVLNYNKESNRKMATQSIVSGSTSKKQASSFKRFLKKIKSFYSLFKTWLKFKNLFLKAIEQHHIGIIYTTYLGGIWTWMFKGGRFKLIYGYTDSSYVALQRNLLDFFNTEYYAMKNADRIDCLSQGISDNLYKYISINPQNIYVTPNSFKDYTNFFPIYPKENHITFLSRLTPLKNPFILLEAVKLIEQELGNTFKVFIIGSGILLPDIVQYVKEQALTTVEIVNGTDEPWHYLRTSRVFVSIQANENYPSQSLLEAMACGNAIIASDVGETRKLVTEREGILVPIQVIEVAKALKHLLTNTDMADSLGKQARDKVLAEHTIEKFAEYFNSLVSFNTK